MAAPEPELAPTGCQRRAAQSCGEQRLLCPHESGRSTQIRAQRPNAPVEGRQQGKEPGRCAQNNRQSGCCPRLCPCPQPERSQKQRQCQSERTLRAETGCDAQAQPCQPEWGTPLDCQRGQVHAQSLRQQAGGVRQCLVGIEPHQRCKKNQTYRIPGHPLAEQSACQGKQKPAREGCTNGTESSERQTCFARQDQRDPSEGHIQHIAGWMGNPVGGVKSAQGPGEIVRVKVIQRPTLERQIDGQSQRN